MHEILHLLEICLLNLPHLKRHEDLIVRFARIEEMHFEVVNTPTKIMLWLLEE